MISPEDASHVADKRNYKKYGYTLDQNSRWTNNIWNQDEAGRLAKKFNNIMHANGNKLTNFQLFYIALNKQLSEIMHIAMKDLDWPQIALETDDVYKVYVKTMLNFEKYYL